MPKAYLAVGDQASWTLTIGSGSWQQFAEGGKGTCLALLFLDRTSAREDADIAGGDTGASRRGWCGPVLARRSGISRGGELQQGRTCAQYYEPIKAREETAL